MQRLQNKVSVITDMAQGIGPATAVKFAQKSATVVVCDARRTAIDGVVVQRQALDTQAVGRTSEAIADVYAFLESNDASYVNSAVNAVAGGMAV